MKITFADIEDARQILQLQKLAYQSEAAIYQDYSIPPLIQTIEELEEDFQDQLFFKAVIDKEIIGSVRAYSAGSSCSIGRLIVHPDWQRRGVGTQLMRAVEAHFVNVRRFELFTGTKSLGNICFYKNLGYQPFKEQVLSDTVVIVYLEKNRP